MKLTIEMSEVELRTILAEAVNERFSTDFSWDNLPIEVRSKQNYKSEWEKAEIRIITHVIR